MAVHCIQIMTSTDVDSQQVKNKISDLKSKYGEKLPKQDAPFTQAETINSSTSFYSASFRVTLTEGSKTTEKNDLTEQIKKEADKTASWWQIRCHECSHDESNPNGCSWEYQNSNNSVPTEVEW